MFRLPPSSTPRIRWPLIVLLLSIGLTAMAVVEAQRAVRTHHSVAVHALREYANFAAWSYGQHLTESMTQLSREAIGAVNHGSQLHTSPRIPRATDLAQYLPYDEACPCHRARMGPSPETFFAIRIGEDTLEVGRADHESMPVRTYDDGLVIGGAELSVPRDYAPAERHWLVDSLTRRVRGAGAPDHGFSFVVDTMAGKPRLIAYTLMPTSFGDTMVYGARYTPTASARVFSDVLDGNGLLPSTFTAGRRNRDILAVRITDGAGRRLFDSAPGVTSPLMAHLDLPSRVGNLSLDMVIRPEVAGTLVIGGLPASRVPFLIGLLALAAALSIVAVAQIRREGELAHLRADFVSNVSHELRTPLAQIRLYLETIRLGRISSDAERDWALGHMDREATRLNNLVDKVLRFSTLDRGLAGPPEVIELSGAVADLVGEFRPLASSRRASIAMHVESTAYVAIAEDGLRHIVLNLLENAVKYGPEGQTICVKVGICAGEATLAVTDQGSGVRDDEREKIWRPFTRGRAARSQGGSGIGLTVARSIAEQHGGRITVRNVAGGGARFEVALPVTEPI